MLETWHSQLDSALAFRGADKNGDVRPVVKTNMGMRRPSSHVLGPICNPQHVVTCKLEYSAATLRRSRFDVVKTKSHSESNFYSLRRHRYGPAVRRGRRDDPDRLLEHGNPLRGEQSSEFARAAVLQAKV